ncbi:MULTISPECIES: P-II family nitrogen regulator [Micrococcales]|uniref:Nitrogen regulatory protein P-II family n=3 Tax=Micrococcales TaxID=85006 RepID=A0ABP8YF55_9MICO|nr:transcriptional regulator [Promicromonospora umidemergens]MCP2286967.1 nitrogen regulatory protein P-II family [Promicromonospora umidemergens]MDV2978228.1 transcriptional regulator [Actinomycetes bacterium ARC8]
MHGLTEMTKVEFVVPGRDAPSIRALITAAGATGYTAVSGVSGIGHHGQHSGALLFNDYDTLTMLITVLPPERAEELITAARELFTTCSGVMFVTDTYVSRPDYFQ